MRKIYIIICLIFAITSCDNNSVKKEINRDTYSVSSEYDSTIDDTLYTFTSLKKIFPKDKSVFYLIFGNMNDKDGIDVNEKSPSFLMKGNKVSLNRNDLLNYLENNYTPSIWIFNIENDKIELNNNWSVVNEYTDSLIFDFSIIDTKDF